MVQDTKHVLFKINLKKNQKAEDMKVGIEQHSGGP